MQEIIDDPKVEVDAGEFNVIPRVGDMTASGYGKLQAAVTESMPEAILLPGLLIATTDSRHYEDLCDDVYHFQPMFVSLEDASGIHGTNERIKVSAYLQSVEFAKVVLRRITES